MIKLGLIGYPLSHSFSAVIHNAALKDLKIDGTYELLETDPEDLVSRIKFLKTRGYAGFNVTIPLKIPVTLFLDKVDDNTNMAGCANTIKIMPDCSLHGYNTDIYGFKTAIEKPVQTILKNKKVSVIGTGGAARACAIGLIELGVTDIDFYARNIINASNMVNFLRDNFSAVSFNLKQINSLANLSDSYMLVNTTPIGMKGNAMNSSPVEVSALKTMDSGAIVYDIIYNPIKTKLIEIAQERELKTINGLDMLIYQAMKSFEIWTNSKPRYEVMKIAALESLASINL